MNPTVAIALRYVRPRRLSAIGLIGGISVVGIAVGTAALIIVLSLFNGFRNVAIDTMTSSGPHLRVMGRPSINVSDIGGARLVQPVYQSTLIVQLPGRTTAARALGVRNDLAEYVVARATMVGTTSVVDRGGISGAVI